ncbi:MAG: hypothetical protein OEL89_00350 [Candidatus Peregrinibacteria bacterium]|nr:hypothetical protein [Candidatus Peregrinibacteria bacterium]
MFAVLNFESILRVNDKTRLDASGSYGGTITQLEIETDTAAGYIDVTTDGYLDFEYSTAGTKAVTVRVNGVDTKSYDIEVLAAVDDIHFSNDQDLLQHRGEILRFTKDGRNSFLDKHRLSRDLIMEYINQSGIKKTDLTDYAVSDIVNLNEVKQWSVFMTLSLIMQEMSNQIDDIFWRDYLEFKKQMDYYKDLTFKFLDLNNDSYEDKSTYVRSVEIAFR